MQLSFKELKGVTRLYEDYLYSFPSLADFFNGDFHSPASFQKIQKDLQFKNFPRPALVDILFKQNQEFGAGAAVLENIQSLNVKETYTVFTGQQIGLFGGPLYTLYKSLTAIKLARKLQTELGNRVVPIFWMATDDHDFAEINHLFFKDKQDRLVKLEYQGQTDWHGRPASQIVLDRNITQTLEILSSGLKDDAHTGTILAKLKDCYSPGRNYYLAFACWMSHLLGRYGLVLFNPADDKFKALLRPIFIAELEKNGRLQNLIEKTSQNLEDRQYHRQVHKKEGTTNLFYHSPGRANISKEDGKFFWEGARERLSGQDLIKLVENSPASFSANVLLRPVLESFAFPNLAHVAGPSEIAYFAQIKPLYEELEVVMPVIYPRSSLTLLEPEIREILARYQISAKEIMQDVEQVYNRVIEQKIPREAEESLNQTQAELKNKILELGEHILKIQPSLKPNLEFTQGKIDFEFNKFKEKFFQAYKKQFKQTKDELYAVRDSIYPQDTLQERIYNITPFLGRYGFEFIDFLYESLDLQNFDHQILELGER